MTDWKPPFEGAVEITHAEWAGIVQRQQDKADRRWNRRRDWLVGSVGGIGGGALGALIVYLAHLVLGGRA